METCRWINHKDDYFNQWHTDCENFELSTRLPREPFIPFYKFCPYCGKKVVYYLKPPQTLDKLEQQV